MSVQMGKIAARIIVALNRTVLTTLICLNIWAAGALWLMPDSGQATMSATSAIFIAFFLAFIPALVFCVAVFVIGIVLRGSKMALPCSLGFWILFVWFTLGRNGNVADVMISVAIGALSGLVFWLLLASVKLSSDVGGQKFFASSKLDRLMSVAFVGAGVFFLGMALADRIEYLFFTEDIASPAIQDEFFRPLTVGELRATRRFPTVEACTIQDGRKDSLPNIDWSRIHNSNEAKICIFRVLQLTGNVEQAATWLAAQGLRVSQNAESGTPNKSPLGRKGDYYVTAGRTIRRSENHTYVYTPLYKAKTPLGQLFSLMAYGVSFVVYYRAGETRPYSVSVSSSTV